MREPSFSFRGFQGRLGESSESPEAQPAQKVDPVSTTPAENRASASRPPAVADGKVVLQVTLLLDPISRIHQVTLIHFHKDSVANCSSILNPTLLPAASYIALRNDLACLCFTHEFVNFRLYLEYDCLCIFGLRVWAPAVGWDALVRIMLPMTAI